MIASPGHHRNYLLPSTGPNIEYQDGHRAIEAHCLPAAAYAAPTATEALLLTAVVFPQESLPLT